MFNDPLIDGHETQADFEAEIQAEADSGLPQLTSEGNYFRTLEHRSLKFSLIHYGNYYGYIDHNGILTTTPGSMPNHTDERAFQTEQAAIDDARLTIDTLFSIAL